MVDDRQICFNDGISFGYLCIHTNDIFLLRTNHMAICLLYVIMENYLKGSMHDGDLHFFPAAHQSCWSVVACRYECRMDKRKFVVPCSSCLLCVPNWISSLCYRLRGMQLEEAENHAESTCFDYICNKNDKCKALLLHLSLSLITVVVITYLLQLSLLYYISQSLQVL